MNLRTYFWHDRILPTHRYYYRKLRRKDLNAFFRYGNAGDLFTGEIIDRTYGLPTINIKNTRDRLLVVGSIASQLCDGDIICGIGTKTGKDVPKNKRGIRIYGLRGPLSFDAFKRSGYDVSNVRFLYDPGLLIRFYAEDLDHSKPKGVTFIPHYRERNLYRGRLISGIKYVDIDTPPMILAKRILESEVILTSSLHGLIFSHALERPCVLVKPKTEEPLFKYQDYFASISASFPRPIEEIGLRNLPDSPITLRYSRSNFFFPEIEELRESKIVCD
jgi:hypothetical protein